MCHLRIGTQSAGSDVSGAARCSVTGSTANRSEPRRSPLQGGEHRELSHCSTECCILHATHTHGWGQQIKHTEEALTNDRRLLTEAQAGRAPR